MMRRRLFALLFLLLLALPAQAQDEYEPEYERAACPFVPPENIEVECGTMIVPEDRADPLGNIVLIGVATFRATGRRPQPDPIFFLNGGPGSYTLETWGEDYSFNYLFAPFIEQRDVVLIDYRGVGSSEPNMFCDEVLDYTFDTLDDALTDAQATDSYTAAVNACRQRLIDFEGVNLRMYNSAVFAQDVADLRRVLGYDVINLFGVSYGTRLALTMLRDQPEGIRSVILDGVYPPQVDRSAENLPNVNRALEALFTACAASRECDAEYPDLRETFYSTARRLNAEPELLSVTLNSSGETVELLLTGDEFVVLIMQSLYASWLLPMLPQAITQAGAGDYTQMQYIAGIMLESEFTFSLGLYITQECSDEEPFNTLDDTIASAEPFPDLAEFYMTEDYVGERAYDDLCETWGGAVPAPIENEPVSSDVPVLIFNGLFDPVTPPAWGERAAETLPNSTVITFPNVGHGALFADQECPQEIAGDFLADPSAALDTACAAELQVAWLLPPQPTATPAPTPTATPLPPLVLVPFTDDAAGLLGVRPEGWDESEPGVFLQNGTMNGLYYQNIPGELLDLFLGDMLSFYGGGSLGSPIETIQVGPREFDIYRLEVSSQAEVLHIAINEQAGRAYVIIVASSEEDADALYEQVFLPAIDAFRAGRSS